MFASGWQAAHHHNSSMMLLSARTDCNSHSLLDQARDYQERGIGVVPLAPNSKVPLRGFPLQQYFQRSPTEAEVARWFERQDVNLGICLGEPSDGLCVRDYDDIREYDRWAKMYPGLAGRLPTVATRRGRHVYFRCDLEEIVGESGGRRIVKYPHGELKATGYAVAPASIVDGHAYDWLVPLDHLGYVKSVAATGLMPLLRCSEAADVSHAIRVASGATDGDVSHAIVFPSLPPDWFSAGPLADRVARIVRIHQPAGYGEREHRLWHLARSLRAVPEFRDETADGLRWVVESWHQLALPRIRTKALWVSLLAFRRCWERVQRPTGMALKAIFARTEGTGFDRFVLLCRELSLSWAPDPFPLDQRAAARLFDVSQRTIGRWLKRLREAEPPVLREAYHGNSVAHRCSEYHYLGA